jgi:hypothetical protein
LKNISPAFFTRFSGIFSDIGGAKKRKALDMIPVSVTEKNRGLSVSATEFTFQHIKPELAKAGSPVKYNQLLVIGPDFHAGGIASEPGCSGAGSGD